MELKKNVKTVISVDSFDLADYIGYKAGGKIEFIDTHNDTDYNVDVRKGKISDYDLKFVDTMLQKGYVSMEYGYNAVFTHCANQGWLEEGDYAIRVSW